MLEFFACTACPCNDSSGQLRLSDGIGSKFHVCNKRRSSCDPCISECYFWSFRGLGCLLRTILVSIFYDNSYNAFFQRRLLHNDGLDTVCQNSFLPYGQINSVLCILIRSSMNLVIHLPRFLCICNFFCFAGIVVETNCALPCKGNVCLPSVRVCTSRTLSLRSFLFAPNPASVIEQ